MFYRKDPRKLLAITQNDIFLKLVELLGRKGPFKFLVTLKVEFKKVLLKMDRSFSNSLNPSLTLRLILL